MRNSDYVRLARLSLTAKKKTTFQTILGISFGLVLLFPILFIALGFYAGFDGQLNADVNLRTQRINYSPVKTVSGKVLCDETLEKNVDKLAGIKNNIKFDYCYVFNGSSEPVYFSINNEEKFRAIRPTGVNSPKRFLGIQIYDESCGNRPFLDSDKDIYGSRLIAGRTFSSRSHSKGEIMVSSLFLRDYGLTAKKVIGSTISMYSYVSRTKLAFSSSKDEIDTPMEYKKSELIPNFKNFKIVGVYNSEIYYRRAIRTSPLCFDLTMENQRYKTARDYFWMTTASLGTNGVNRAPERIIKENKVDEEIVSYDTWYYYEDVPSVLSEKVTDSGLAFLQFGLGFFNRGVFDPLYSKTQLIEFSNFRYARKAYDKIMEIYKKSVTGDPEDGYRYYYENDIAPARYERYESFYDRFVFICVILGAFGGIIFLATILNVINTMHFSVESGKGFLGICRAEGMKKAGIRKIFLNQINIIFGISYISTILIGGAACIWVKILFDRELQDFFFDETRMDMTLGWWYIPISFAILLILTTAMSYLISFMLVRKINKTPVLEILSEEGRM